MKKTAIETCINKIVKEMEKKFDPGTATTLTGMFTPEKVRGFVPTGNLAVDYVIGRTGIPLGRISEIAGPYSSGKSSMVAAIIGAAQKKGVVCILIDTEHSYESNWSRMYGVDPEHLILIEPKHLEGLFDRLRAVIKIIRKEEEGVPDPTPIFIAVDSLSATPTSGELEEEDSTSGKQRAAHAKIIAEGLRKISNEVFNQNVALLFVSQLKDDPGMMFGANKHKLGGHAVEFHAGLMLEVKRTGYIKIKDETTGQHIKVTAVKNKFVPPFRTCTFDLFFNEGIRPKEIMVEFLSDKELLGDKALIEKKGGWYEYEGSKFRKEDIAEKMSETLMPDVYKALNILGSDFTEVKGSPIPKEEKVVAHGQNDSQHIEQITNPTDKSGADKPDKEEVKMKESDSPADQASVNISDVV